MFFPKYNADDPAQYFDLMQEVSDGVVIKPEFRGLLEELVNLQMSEGWGEGDQGEKF